MATHQKHRKLSLPLILAILVVLIAGGLAGGKWIVWPRVKAWREQRTNNVAREKLAQGDLAAAMTAVRSSLRYNPQNVDTWKLGLEIATKQKSPEEFAFLQRIALLEPTLENRLKFIRLAVQSNYLNQAQEVIAKIGPEGANSADFLELAATVSRRMNNPTRAKYYMMALLSMRPNDNNVRFELAQLRMIDGFSENKPAIRTEIRALASDPALHERAIALLLADAVEQKNANEALEYADQLATTINIAAQHQILIAETYRRFAPGRLSAYLAKLEQTYTDTPEKVVTLAGYLTNNNQTAELCRWIDTLPETTKAIEGVQIAYAYALLLQKKWEDLDTYLHGCKWKENEFARHAMLAYKNRAIGSDRLFNEEWKLAVIEVGNSQRKLQSLLARVISWNWQEERYELLWKRFSIDPNDPATRQQLTSWEISKGNTAGLNRLFSRIVETSPTDIYSKNNFAYTSLLLGTNLDQAFELARENLKTDPKNPNYITTQSLALYKQGKPQEALQILDSVGIVGLSQSERLTLRALYLAESGKTQEGADLITNVRPATLSLPEERRLYDSALAIIAKAERESGNVARLASLTAQHTATSTDRKSWIAMLPEALRKPASVPMELADTFYSTDDFKGLENSLKSDHWEQNDFLRLALLTYAQRGMNRDSEARVTWRTTLASAGSAPTNLSALTEMCERWGWSQERIELFSRTFQRDPLNEKLFIELSDYYTKAGQTAELAHVYEQRCDANPADLEAKSHLAYYSMLIGNNLSRAHVLAREAFDAAPEDAFRAKVYAFSLFKQSRPGDAWRTLEQLPDKKESGQAQASLIKATVALQRLDKEQAKACLDRFDAASALPEETTLAKNLAETLSKKDN
jgi:cytochrome c-type biogenesis protein CcmH/NrfG